MSRIFIIAATAIFLAAPASAQTNTMSSNTMGATHNGSTKNCVKAASKNAMSGNSMSSSAMSSNTMGAHPATKPCSKPDATAPSTMGGSPGH